MNTNNNLFYIDTRDIPKDSLGKRFLWTSSSGCKVYFRYNNVEGEFLINDVFRKNNTTYLNITYKGNIYKIAPEKLLAGYIQHIVGKSIAYKYNVGDAIDNIKIINRTYNNSKYNQSIKWYECQCTNCNSHFNRTEYELNKSIGCPVCSNAPKKVVKGVNDIATTDPWMIPFFYNIEDAYTHTKRSSKKTYMRCPDCQRKSDHKISISNLYKNKGFQCICSDGISYPNKFIYKFVEQLNVENVIREYSPEWLGLRKFDIYFEYENRKYVIEMDGGLGHGRIKFASKEKDDIGLEIDNEKDNLAKQHNIYVIRIDAQKSELEYLKYNIEISVLSNIFNLSEIDWIDCEEFARSNLIKTICNEYENDIFISPEILSKKYNLSYRTIINYINIGRKIGWVSSKQKDNIRTRIIRYTPLLVNDKYYFSCLKSFEENAVDIFNLDSISIGSLPRRLKAGSIIYKGLKLEYIDKILFKEKYKTCYEYIYL